MKGVNLHIYQTNFKYESRMLKETKSIAEADIVDQIHIAAIWDEGLEEHERIDEKRQVWRVQLRIGNQQSGFILKLMRYIEWQVKVFLAFRTRSVKIVNCHSIAVLPIGPLFKLFSKSMIVYDTHECETETQSSVGIRRPLLKLTERLLIRSVDAVITVSESISQWYRNEYGLNNVYTVRNVPYQRDIRETSEVSILKSELGIPDDEILFIYQGRLSRGRGIEILLDVFGKADRRKHVVFMGYGPWEEMVKEYERVHPNIHFRDAVSPQDVQRYSSSADVGLALIERVCLSYYITIANRVFEYIMSGLPLIVSDFPEMGRVVDDGRCGWKVAVDRDALLSLITAISWNDIVEKRNNALQYRMTIGWHKEEKVLLQVYHDLERVLADRPRLV